MNTTLTLLKLIRVLVVKDVVQCLGGFVLLHVDNCWTASRVVARDFEMDGTSFRLLHIH